MTKIIYLFKNISGLYGMNINSSPSFKKASKLETLVQETHKEIKATPSVLKMFDYGTYLDARWVRDYKVVLGVPQRYPRHMFRDLSDNQKDYVRRVLRHRGPDIPDGSLFDPLNAEM
jgi:hypothetical protein